MSPTTTTTGTVDTPLGVSESGSILLSRIDYETTPNPEDRLQVLKDRTEIRMRVNPDGSPRSVTRVKARMVRGTSSTGKSFTRWQSTAITSILQTKSGKQVLFVRSFGRHRGAQTHGYYGDAGIGADLSDMAEAILGKAPTREQLYPLARDLRLHVDRAPARFLAAWLNAADPQTLTRNLFGKRRYRKDLVKGCAGADPLGIHLAWQMRDLVPVDYLVLLLRTRARATVGVRHPAADIRKHLRVLDRTSLRRLAGDAASAHVAEYVRDLARMDVAPAARVRSWRELHDHTAAYATNAMHARSAEAHIERMRGHDELLALISAERASLQGVTAAGARIVAASEPSTLVVWGTTMHNCIAHYASEMIYGQCHLLAMYEGGALVANIEVRTGRRGVGTPVPATLELRQLLGPGNRSLPADRRADAVAHLAAAGVTIPDTYWGNDDREDHDDD